MHDDASSSLPGGLRRPKSDALFDALGSLDELNAALGLLRAHPAARPDAARIESLQRELLLVGSEIAAGPPRLDPDAVAALERDVARRDAAQPPPDGFVLPGASEASARAHWARAVCRRAERDLVRAREAHPDRVSPQALAYLNRLSALLFALARSL